MATKGGNRGENGNTKVRFIMFEADGNAADLQQFAQAIASAIRPTVIQPVMAPPSMPVLTKNAAQPSIEANHDLRPSVEIVDEGVTTTPPASKKPSGRTRVRRYPMPTVLELDLTSGDVPFAQYYHQKNPDDHSKRYLVIAAWLKEFHQLDEISDDHIYTCYRTLGLNTVADIGSVFRGCKKQGWFNPGSQRGCFAINHVGLNEVNNLSNGE